MDADPVGIVEAIQGSVIPHVVAANGVAAGVVQEDATPEARRIANRTSCAVKVGAIALDLVVFERVGRRTFIESDPRTAILLSMVLQDRGVVR